MSSRAEYRRRSSFVQGRRRSSVISPPPGFSSRSCSSIPKPFPTKDRLIELTQLCFESAVQQVNDEFASSADVQTEQLPTVASPCLTSKLQESDFLSVGAARVKSTDSFRDAQIQEIRHHITELKEESRKWEDILHAEMCLGNSSQTLPSSPTIKSATKELHSSKYASILPFVRRMWLTMEHEGAFLLDAVRTLTGTLHVAQAHRNAQVCHTADDYYPVELQEHIVEKALDSC